MVPVLISPAEPEPEAAAPTSSGPVMPPAVSTRAPTPTPTPTPTRTPSPFLVRPAVQPRPVADPPRRIYREFQSTCALTRTSDNAPLAGLGAGPFQFAGSTAKTLATPGKVPGGTSSCVAAGDRSTYWTPVLRQGKQTVVPETFEVLYKSGVDDYTGVQPFPAGLRLIAGGPVPAPDRGRVSWSCTGYDEAELPDPGTCRDGDKLTMRLTAPSCWDGRHLDVGGHRSHLTWPLAGRCPGSHPVAVPELLLRIVYPLEGTGTLRLTSGTGAGFGFGFVAGWQPSALAELLKQCVNAGRQCDATGPT